MGRDPSIHSCPVTLVHVTFFDGCGAFFPRLNNIKVALGILGFENIIVPNNFQV